MIENLEISRIRRDGGTQPRAALDDAVIAEYTDAVQAGAEFPPVAVFYDGEHLWLTDGFHRTIAHERAGKHYIAALVHQGTQRDAVLFSTGVNAEHGLRRSNSDKRRSVEVLLRDAQWSKWSDNEIARQCKVSHELVRQMRPILQNLQDSPDRTVIVKRNGATYTMRTGAIGRPDPDMATPEHLKSIVYAWLTKRFPGSPSNQRIAINQIGLGNAVGLDHINTIADFARQAGHSVLTADLRRACLIVQGEIAAPEATRAAKIVYTPQTPDPELVIAPPTQVDSATLPDVPIEPTGPGIRSEAEVEAAAQDLTPLVWRFLGLSSASTEVEKLAHAEHLTGSLLDVEGFSAHRGHNYDWVALVGHAGPSGQNDMEALRRAVEIVRAEILTRQQTEAESGLLSPEEPDVITQWFARLVEENSIPAQRNGEPEPDAVRMVLHNILHNRENGGAKAWRSLRSHPAWPVDSSTEDKLSVVRQALAALQPPGPNAPYHRPQATPPPAQSIETLLERKERRINELTDAITKALGYLKSLAGYSEPDDDLIETIAVLERARSASQ